MGVAKASKSQVDQSSNHSSLSSSLNSSSPNHSPRNSQQDFQRVNNPAKISVIIPTKNERDNLQHLLPVLQAHDCEVWVVDGGSQDDSVAIAQSLGAQVQLESQGRAQQMNRGAQSATGDILLFLHADTRLPLEFESLVREALGQPGVVAGAFELRIEGQGVGLRWVEFGVYWRSRLFQMPYGDQALFLHRSVFESLGGFAPLPIMEDFELVQRLKQLGRVALVPVPVKTSARRWKNVGVLQTTLLNQLMILGYFLGVPSQRLARWYRGRSDSANSSNP